MCKLCGFVGRWRDGVWEKVEPATAPPRPTPTPTAYQLDTLRRDQNVGIMTVLADVAFVAYVAHVFDCDGTRRHTTSPKATEAIAFEAARSWVEENCNDSWGVVALV